MDLLDPASSDTSPRASGALVESLLGPKQFEPVFAGGRKFELGSVTLRALRRPDSAAPRLGLIVPKKKTRLAVFRNAFKRVAREALLQAVQADPRAAGLDVVIQFKGLPALSLREFKLAAARDARAALALALDPASAVSPASRPRPPKR